MSQWVTVEDKIFTPRPRKNPGIKAALSVSTRGQSSGTFVAHASHIDSIVFMLALQSKLKYWSLRPYRSHHYLRYGWSGKRAV